MNIASGGSAVEVSYSMVCIEKGLSIGAVRESWRKALALVLRESRRLVSCVAQPEGAGEGRCVFLPHVILSIFVFKAKVQ